MMNLNLRLADFENVILVKKLMTIVSEGKVSQGVVNDYLGAEVIAKEF